MLAGGGEIRERREIREAVSGREGIVNWRWQVVRAHVGIAGVGAIRDDLAARSASDARSAKGNQVEKGQRRGQISARDPRATRDPRSDLGQEKRNPPRDPRAKRKPRRYFRKPVERESSPGKSRVQNRRAT